MFTQAFKWESRRLPLLILACYLLPLLLFVGFAVGTVPSSISWAITSLGLVLLCFGTSLLLILLRSLESSIPTQPQAAVQAAPQVKIEPPPYKVDASNLSEKLNDSLEQLQKLSLEKEQVSLSFNTLEANFEKERTLFQEQTKERELTIENLQETLSQQNTLLEQYQSQILKLKNENADLKYEVRTLLQLGEVDPSPQTRNKEAPQPLEVPISPALQNEHSVEASSQLKKCLELAESLEGSSRLYAEATGTSSEFPIEMQTLDLRRLADLFRSEANQPLLLYSPSRGKLLFASDQIAELLGWSKEKTLNEFFSIIQKGKVEWEQAVMSLNQEQESHARLVLRTKSGQDLLLYCQMGRIKTGIFSNQVIALFYNPV